MSDLQNKLIGVIAAMAITAESINELKLPEPFGILRWTGWKESQYSIEKHAQLLWFTDRHKGFYVDIPSMQHGAFKVGEVLNISGTLEKSHFLHDQVTEEDVREWFTEAFRLILSDVIADSPWMSKVPRV